MILPHASGGHPEWHIQGDVLEQLDKGWVLNELQYLKDVRRAKK